MRWPFFVQPKPSPQSSARNIRVQVWNSALPLPGPCESSHGTPFIGIFDALCALVGGCLASAQAAQAQTARVSRAIGTSIEIVAAASVARTG